MVNTDDFAGKLKINYVFSIWGSSFLFITSLCTSTYEQNQFVKKCVFDRITGQIFVFNS